MLSLHTATLALVEILLVGVATARAAETLSSLDSLNALSQRLARADMTSPGAKDAPSR